MKRVHVVCGGGNTLEEGVYIACGGGGTHEEGYTSRVEGVHILGIIIIVRRRMRYTKRHVHYYNYVMYNCL